MTAVIAYDRPVKNLIDELSATGHVSHRSYRKTSVTLHHNGGRLSHEGVLNVWKTRPASAHFDADGKGDICQYVKVNEYAWAVGNTVGNQQTISIEMANSATGGDWPVAEATWRAAARLAGWLFAKVIGARPDSDNLFYHHHWKPTTCAGPFMDSIYGRVLAEAQRWYDHFRGTAAPRPSTPTSTPRKSLTQIAAEVWQGKWGSGDDRRRRLKAAGYDPDAVQRLVNRGVGNAGSTKPPASSASSRPSVATVADQVIDGKWGNGAERRQRLIRAGYNPASVQAAVNNKLSHKSSPKKSISTIASEVIDGKWGNGPDRQRRLAAAGYNYKAVQAEVNRRL